MMGERSLSDILICVLNGIKLILVILPYGRLLIKVALIDIRRSNDIYGHKTLSVVVLYDHPR